MNSSPKIDEARLVTVQDFNESAWFTIRLGDVPSCNEAQVIGKLSIALANAGFAAQLSDQTIAWRRELSILRQTAELLVAGDPSCAEWVVALEYEIPRRGKRIDTVLLTPNVVMVIEFKIGATTYTRADLWQVQDYALDVRDFHEASVGISIQSILVATDALAASESGGNQQIAGAWCSNATDLPSVIMQLAPTDSNTTIDPMAWLQSGYRPTPTIVEAARRVFAGHNVRELSHAYADNLTRTTDVIAGVIENAKCHGRRVICFVTGVPGSGKTLAGLTAMQDARAIELGAGKSSFMSGNGPLVRVLRDALVRDQVILGEKRDHAKRKTELLVQNVHRFIEEYGVRKIDSVPPDYVIAFDEAQRAWHAAKLSKRHKGIGRSEPDLVLEIMSRPPEWSVVVALVGGGQEIHDGEAGLEEWGRAISRSTTPWEVVVSPDVIHGGTSVAGHRLFAEPNEFQRPIQSEPALHLSVSVRSPRAQQLAEWVNAVLSLDASGARNALKSVEGFRLLITRSLADMRTYLHRSATGNMRAGLLADSRALRLRPYGLELDPDFHRNYPIEHWFLDDRDDYRSSKSLEVAMTEFECQGLELDYVGLCWSDGFTVNESASTWECRYLRGKKWLKLRDKVKRQYLLNKYRVLLTRSREGMVIWIPPGDSNDPTRPPEPLNRTAEFLRDAGAIDLEPHESSTSMP
jgi:schlafen family protein